MTKAFFKRAVPYEDDAMNLPVNDVAAAIPFYETVFDLKIVSQSDTPHASVVLARDDIQIGLAENGGDPTQEGCFFEVDNVETAFAELQRNGLGKDDPKYTVQTFGDGSSYRMFFLVAPDGLCYCIGVPVEK
jgi:predicted enzyme related to lactoylglutathione lyase